MNKFHKYPMFPNHLEWHIAHPNLPCKKNAFPENVLPSFKCVWLFLAPGMVQLWSGQAGNINGSCTYSAAGYLPLWPINKENTQISLVALQKVGGKYEPSSNILDRLNVGVYNLFAFLKQAKAFSKIYFMLVEMSSYVLSFVDVLAIIEVWKKTVTCVQPYTFSLDSTSELYWVNLNKETGFANDPHHVEHLLSLNTLEQISQTTDSAVVIIWCLGLLWWQYLQVQTQSCRLYCSLCASMKTIRIPRSRAGAESLLSASQRSEKRKEAACL